MKLFFYLILLLFLSFFTSNIYSQNDSDKIRIGPEEIQRPGGPHFYNFADKNKVNILIILLGGGASGKYLIPEGTTVFDLLIMAGATSSKSLENIKLVKFKSETPTMQGKDFQVLDFGALYEDDKNVLRGQKNPKLSPGDMIILPEPSTSPSFWVVVTTIISVVGTLISFYYLIYNVVNDNFFR